MPYSTLVHAESTQNDGYAGVAGKGPTGIGFSISGDTIVLIDKEFPYIYRYGAHSITKPQACKLNFTNMGTRMYGGGAVDFHPAGISGSRSLPQKLYRGETVTGYASNTNVAEDTIIMYEIAYNHITSWDISEFAGKQIFPALMTLTAGAAVTYNSGPVTVYDAATDPTDWFDANAYYDILGAFGVIGADGGVVHITNLPDDWARHAPGFPINPLDTVLFGTRMPYFYLLEPIRGIPGNQLKNNVTLGITATATNATTFGLLMARDKDL